MAQRLIVGLYGLGKLTGERRPFFEQLAENGATGIRMFGHFGWGAQEAIWTPFDRVLTLDRINDFPWSPPAPGEEARKKRYIVGPDGLVWFKHGKYSPPIVPVYDLAVFNDAYFESVEEIFTLCKEFGLSIEPFELDDNCSDKGDGILKYWSPYLSSPQGHSAATPGGLFGSEIKRYMWRYWQKVIGIANRVKPEIYWSVRNEYDWRGHDAQGNPWPEETQHRNFLEWYNSSMNLIKEISSRPFIGSAMRYHDEILALCGKYSLHGIGDQKSYKKNIALLPNAMKNGKLNLPYIQKMYLSGDGFSTGTGIRDFKGRRGITLTEVPWLADKVKEGFAGYEMLIRYKQGHARGDLADFEGKYNGLKIVREFARRFDILPPLPPSPPEPEPPQPEPPEPEPEHKTFWQRLWEWLKDIFS